MAGFKRKVFYVGGFDPRGVRFYHGLMREAVARWGERTGEAASVSARRNPSPIRADWTIRNETADVTTEYSFLRWEDLVARAWIRSPLALAGAAVRTYWSHWRHLDLRTLLTFQRGPLVTLFYPIVLSVLLPIAIGLPVFGLSLLALPWWGALIAGLVVGIAAAVPILIRIQAPWLLRFFAFNADLSRPGSLPDIQARLDAFADEVQVALDEGGENELLLVSHSNGGILAVALMARLLRANGGRMPERFALVTLGHCIPLVACRRDAGWFHDDLRAVAAGDFRWYDIGSPPDGAAYAGMDPMRIVAPAPEPRLTLLNPCFFRFYGPGVNRKGLANKYDVHFDYLRVHDRVSPIDVGSLTAGDRPIADAVAAFKVTT